MNNQTNQISQNWLNLSIENSKNALYAIRLSGLMIKHQDIIDKAIEGTLSSDKLNQIIDWLINNLPKTDNAQSDSMILENAWMIYSIGAHQNQAQNDELVNNATDFLTMLRTKYLEARLRAGKQA